MKTKLILAALCMAAVAVFAARSSAPRISGDYLEVRSCDIYTGPCFANSEMGVSGREGMMVWTVREGVWNGVGLKGLSVIAVVRTDDTLGDLSYQPCSGPAVLIVDARADSQQEAALCDFARAMAGRLIREVAAVKSASMDVTLKSGCSSGSCASVKAGSLVEISTRCLGNKDHICGHEEAFYPPLTNVKDALAAYAETASFNGTGLGLTWQMTDKRSAYLASFAQ